MRSCRDLLCATLVALLAGGCTDGTAPANPWLRLTGLVVARDGTPGLLAVAVAPEGPPTPGPGRYAASATLRMATGATAELIGVWDEQRVPPDQVSIPERFGTLDLDGGGWTFSKPGNQSGLGTFDGPRADGYFLVTASTSPAPATAYCGTWSGTTATADTTTAFTARAYLLLGGVRAVFVVHAAGQDIPAAVYDAMLTGRALRAGDGSSFDISGTVTSDGRAVAGTYSISVPGVSVRSTWSATDAACVGG